MVPSSILGLGYVIIPRNDDVDRDEFVDMCLKTSTILLLTKNGEQFEHVKVNNSLFNDIKFPTEEDELGSIVIFGYLSDISYPVILGTIPNGEELLNQAENTFKLSRSLNESNIEIVGNASIGSLSLKVNTNEEGVLQLSINGDIDSNLNINSSGNVNIQANKIKGVARESFNFKVKALGETEETNISYELGTGFAYKDEFNNEISLDGDKILLKGKRYNMTAENDASVKTLLNDIITEISNITTSTALGIQPIINKLQIEELKEKVKKIFV